MTQRNKKSGFTLVEMIVSVALFTVVALIVSSVFVVVARSNRQAQALRVLADNMSFVLDTVSYNLKLGGKYRCGFLEADGSCSKIIFKDSLGVEQFFAKQDVRVIDSNGDPLTTDNIQVTFLDFQIKDTGARPLVQIFLSGEGVVNNKTIRFNLQTAVSQRNWVSNDTF